MEARDEMGAMSVEKIKDYAASTGKISSAVESLMKQDGWQIFIALYEREKQRIKEKDDYATLEAFKGDRAAIEIVEAILDTFKGFMQDASEAAILLKDLSTDDLPKDRGIMLIEATEGATMEG